MMMSVRQEKTKQHTHTHVIRERERERGCGLVHKVGLAVGPLTLSEKHQKEKRNQQKKE